MLFETFETEITPIMASVIFGLLLGAVFGATAQISRFCLRRGVVGTGADRMSALGVWLTALLVAVIGTQAAVGLGYVDFSDHRFAAAELPLMAILLGGVLFGAGMVLTRGCVSRLTVLGATGNLRAVFVLVVFAIVAHATLKGVLAPVRVPSFISVAISLSTILDRVSEGISVFFIPLSMPEFMASFLMSALWSAQIFFKN